MSLKKISLTRFPENATLKNHEKRRFQMANKPERKSTVQINQAVDRLIYKKIKAYAVEKEIKTHEALSIMLVNGVKATIKE
jgi:hypothetical protein